MLLRNWLADRSAGTYYNIIYFKIYVIFYQFCTHTEITFIPVGQLKCYGSSCVFSVYFCVYKIREVCKAMQIELTVTYTTPYSYMF